MKTYSTPLAQRPRADGTVLDTRHAPYYLVLEVMGDSWLQLLADTAPSITGSDIAVVGVQASFLQEVFTDEATSEVRVLRIGTSSIAFGVTLVQGGRPVARAEMVVARVNPDRTGSLPLTEEMRALLATELDEP